MSDGVAPDDDTDRTERARGALVGLACGDALGRPVAGDSAAAVRDRYGRVTDLLGADGRRAGTTTDRTGAAVATARDLTGESPERPLDGAATVAGPAAGAGLTAAVPVGLVDATAAERADAAAGRAAAGDGDTDAATVEAAAALAVVVGELVDGATTDAALATARTVALDRGAPVPLRETLAVVGDRAAVTLATAGSAVALLETALHEATTADGVDGAAVSAVSRGGDASTLGAVAGAVAGAREGEAAVPARWRNELSDRVPELRRLADLLVGVSLRE
ncbi:ADP-ribosylglycohydrolase family protein [Halobaculum lipolyticum]|uniref:ADP-ribosylglycohydrolase family protein n=1 Tax=Halobaculum lipolyticum TaxID=3032001 RepID=UPI0024C2AE4C|nr:ADP-ribosylglycohydrolase family protein [Halobaculum sp. DT31]